MVGFCSASQCVVVITLAGRGPRNRCGAAAASSGMARKGESGNARKLRRGTSASQCLTLRSRPVQLPQSEAFTLFCHSVALNGTICSNHYRRRCWSTNTLVDQYITAAPMLCRNIPPIPRRIEVYKGDIMVDNCSSTYLVGHLNITNSSSRCDRTLTFVSIPRLTNLHRDHSFLVIHRGHACLQEFGKYGSLMPMQLIREHCMFILAVLATLVVAYR